MMKKNNIQIEIPQPCHEKWNEMTPVEKGNFCMSCQKVVVDFTSKSDREIGQFFKQSKGNLCGRFRPNQLNRSIPLMPKVSTSYSKASAALFSGLLLTAGVTAQTNPNVEVTAPRPVVERSITGMVVSVAPEGEKPRPQRYIKGVVVDADYNEPLIGANILISNTNIGTVTDIDGRFELLIPEEYHDQIEDLSVEVSYFGYENKHIEYSLFSEDMKIDLFARLDIVCMTGVIVVTQEDQTLWQSGRRLWNRLQYNNPIRNWLENRQEKKAQKEKDTIIPTREMLNNHEKKGETHIQTTENAAFMLSGVSPNPFHSIINLNVKIVDAGKLTMSLFTEDGKRVFDRTDALEEGTQTIQLDVSASNLVAGIYILNIFHENGFQKSEVLILQ